MRECLDEALEGVRHGDDADCSGASSTRALWRDLEALVRDEAASELPLVPRRFEVAFGTERAAPELQRGLELGEGLTLSGKIDRIDVDPFSARGIVQDYKSGKSAHSAHEDRGGAAAPDPALHARPPRPGRDRAARRRLPAARRRAQGARAAARGRRARTLPGFAKNDYLDEEAFWGQVETRARDGADGSPAASAAGDVRARPARRRLPELVRPLADVPGEARVNPEQQAAVDARGRVFVSAGAGTGKTAVLVERFVARGLRRGLDVDSILVITYTKQAAGELRSRIRAALVERGRPDLARELDGAWISTIHGFCNRLLQDASVRGRARPALPRARRARRRAVLRGEAFDAALAEFCAGDEPDRLRLLATYGGARAAADAHRRLRDAALGRAARSCSSSASRPTCSTRRRGAPRGRAVPRRRRRRDRAAAREGGAPCSTCSTREPRAEQLLDLSDLRASRRARRELRGGAQAGRAGGARRARDARDRDLLQELLERFDAAYAAAKERESALDFEDLQLAARDLLRDQPEIRERESLRFRSIMVDEFQDTNRAPVRARRPARARRRPSVFFVGDEFQSIYGFRHADVGVFRERRARGAGRCSR